MKLVFKLLVLVLPMSLIAQDFSENWTEFYSYYNIKDVSDGNNKIYAAAENAILIYDIPTDSVRTVSSVNGLSGELITAIHYSETYESLIIGYENGLIEVINDNSTEVTSVGGIIEEVSISPLDKRINHFMEFEDNIYVSTDFGIVLYNLPNLEFGDTYRIGDNGEELQVKQTTVRGETIYAATFSGGIRYADVTSEDLIDFEEWQGITTSSFDAVQVVGSQVYAAQNNGSLHRVEGTNLVFEESLGIRARDLRVNNENELILTTQSFVRVYDENLNLLNAITTLQDISQNYVATAVVNGEFFIGHDEVGLIATSTTLSPEFVVISPDGPLLNSIFNMEALDNELWVTFGEHNIFYNPYPRSDRGISHLVEDEWRNIPYDSLMGALDIIEVTSNPFNSEQVFFSSFGDGLLEVNNEVPTQFFTGNNSAIFDFIPNGTDGSRVNGTAFNSEGTLYLAQGFTDIALYKKEQDSDVIMPIDDLIDNIPTLGDGLLGKIVIDRNDNLYIGSQTQGLVGYQPSTGIVTQLKDDVGGAGLPDNDIRALEFDQNGRLWIGSLTGLRVLFNPQSIFTEDNVTVEPIIIEENGVPQELLFSQFVTSIEVDGANNKWIGTAQSGVFYLSPNGQETLLRFTKENSPLPSNIITDIRIDEASGRVYIGTPNGLLAYNATATSPQDNLENVRAYPNPVRPNFNGVVVIDGLTARANVKITDITGNLVYEDTSVGGSIEWDTTAFGKHRVASGVYLILITAEDALETKVHKLMIIR